MKKLIAVSTLVFATNTFAAWEVNQNGIALQPSYGNFSNGVALEHDGDEFYISVITLKSAGLDCSPSTPIWMVNETPVRFESFCDQGASRSYPQSEKGMKYVLNEFKTKNSVKIGSNSYSAVGFTKAMNEVKAWDEKMKDAL
ncbi:exported hypothetical protein [Vibrio owensii]|uniref:Uncharacterized protein n=1 Tax=Vibrio owensii TaxID=696485 RepID=A0AAU9PZQ3_9VIBR|nr:exported hypothetical protein [Vibrio owensii]